MSRDGHGWLKWCGQEEKGEERKKLEKNNGIESERSQRRRTMKEMIDWIEKK